MLQRKMNAGIGLLVTLLLFVHAISISVWTLSGGSIENVPTFIPWALTGLTLLHVFISIDMAISALMNAEKRPCKQYPKMNVSTWVQRISGVLMVIFTGLHIAGAMGYMKPPKVIHGIVPPLFFAIVLVHIAVSTSKALITLGIGNAKLVKAVDVAVKVLCGVTLIADVVGFYLYLW